jgi:hypothetical protein
VGEVLATGGEEFRRGGLGELALAGGVKVSRYGREWLACLRSDGKLSRAEPCVVYMPHAEVFFFVHAAKIFRRTTVKLRFRFLVPKPIIFGVWLYY